MIQLPSLTQLLSQIKYDTEANMSTVEINHITIHIL